MKRIEKLIDQFLTNPKANDDELLGTRILKEFYRGASLEYLRPLLFSSEERVAILGAWIASELEQQQGKPLLSVVGELLRHPAMEVRFWIIGCILDWAGPSEARDIAQVVQLLDDPIKAVRLKTMTFLSRASRSQLESALVCLRMEKPVSSAAFGLSWLLSADGSDVKVIKKELQSPDARMRKYAAAAAARLSAKNRHPLDIAASSEDLEVARFASGFVILS